MSICRFSLPQIVVYSYDVKTKKACGKNACTESLFREPDTVSDRILVGYGIGSEAGKRQILSALIEEGILHGTSFG